MQVSVLGPLRVQDGARELPVAGSRVRRLLVRLAVDAPRSVSTAELVDAVWYDTDAPAQVTNALQSLVSRLRRAVGDAHLVQQTSGGYRLVGCEIDLDVFHRSAAQGRAELAADEAEAAGSTLRNALQMWSGHPLADAGDADYAIGLSARLSEARIEAICDRIDADLAMGDTRDLVAELDELTVTLPLRERLTGQQMRALAGTGRSAEALAVYARLAERLAEELGADPSPALQQVHLAVLRGETMAPAAGDARAVLRVSLTSFVGRVDELKRIHELLSGGRLTTVVGPGGAGKTRLATEAARTWQAPRPWDGHWLIELAPITEEANLVQAFLTSLDIREARSTERPTERPAGRDPLTRLVEALRDRHCLLIVDNCEHLIDRVAHVLARLLASCPHVRVLATSREPIGIDGEALCVVPPLVLPAFGCGPEEALSFPSVQLLYDRASAVQAEFVVSSETVADTVEIVRRLDGLPLAIELAAARLRFLPVSEVAARLNDRFRLLTGGSRAAMPRHRTLRAVVEWSWDLLSEPERLIAERLAVFPAGTTVAGARAVCSGGVVEEVDVPDLLDSLVEKSLLHVSDIDGLRYRMLETIREYGVERLAERGEIDEVRHRHARHFAGVVEREAALLRGPAQLGAFATIEREHDNIMAALRFLGDSGGASETLTLALDLSWYWLLRNEHSDAHSWLSFAFSVPGASELDLGVVAEAGMLINEMASGDSMDVSVGGARGAYLTDVSDRLHKLPKLGERFEPGRALIQIALALMTDDHDRLHSLLDESLTSPDEWTRAAARMLRAAIAENRGDIAEMRIEVVEAIASFEALGDRWGLATALSSRGYVQTLDGDLSAAAASYDEASRLMEELRARADGGFTRLRLAGLLMRQGRFAAAREVVQDVIDAPSGRSEPVITFAEATLAMIAWAEGDLETMRRSRAQVVESLEHLATGPGPHAHARAISLAVVSMLFVEDGEVELARNHLTKGYPVALATRDQPVMALLGGSVALLASTVHEFALAARILGACAVLRGGDDPTDPVVSRLTNALRGELGDSFDGHYRQGTDLSHADAMAAIDPAIVSASPG